MDSESQEENVAQETQPETGTRQFYSCSAITLVTNLRFMKVLDSSADQVSRNWLTKRKRIL